MDNRYFSVPYNRASTAEVGLVLQEVTAILDRSRDFSSDPTNLAEHVVDSAASVTDKKINMVAAHAPVRGTDTHAPIDSVPVEIWEGRVEEIRKDEGVFEAVLVSKLGGQADHVAEIEISEISDQDINLLRLGGIFYLSIFKTVNHGSTIFSSQELRFRRLPTWTKSQVNMIRTKSKLIREKFRPTPVADD